MRAETEEVFRTLSSSELDGQNFELCNKMVLNLVKLPLEPQPDVMTPYIKNVYGHDRTTLFWSAAWNDLEPVRICQGVAG